MPTFSTGSGTAEKVALQSFLVGAPLAALVKIASAKGSTPREQGAWMLVAAGRTFGTIGGGQLEFMAIDRARGTLASHASAEGAKAEAQVANLDIPLGPEIGQCCGGRVELAIRVVDDALRRELIAEAERREAALPHVYIFGGGHVGHALAAALSLLPVRVTVVETRAEALEDMPDSVETRLVAMPEAELAAAPPGSAFVVLTHDHALDFVIVAEALKRADAVYVGMIGSRTKRATFRSWFLGQGGAEAGLSRLISPIGGTVVKDKRPAVIAALAAAEIVQALLQHRGG